MLEPKVHAKTKLNYLPMSIIGKGMAAFEAIQISQLNESGLFETPENIETRALALLNKIFGEDAHFAIRVTEIIPDDLAPFFAIDNMGLKFVLGATTEDDCFQLSFLSAKPARPIRSLAGVGMALLDAMDMIDDHLANHALGLI